MKKRDRGDAACCLAIVDMQNAMIPPLGALAVPNAEKCIPNINLLQKRYGYRFQCILFSQAWQAQPGSPGYGLAQGMEVGEDAHIVKKSPQNERSVLIDWMVEKRVSSLYIAGVTLEGGVKELALQAIAKGIAAYVLTDTVATLDPAAGQAARQEMVTAGVTMTLSTTL